jgi:hypothetical protein
MLAARAIIAETWSSSPAKKAKSASHFGQDGVVADERGPNSVSAQAGNENHQGKQKLQCIDATQHNAPISGRLASTLRSIS